MERLIIEGGVPLRGTVQISGSKNSALPCLFAALLTDDECMLENVPQLDDIDTACSLLTVLGKRITKNKNTIIVSRGRKGGSEAPYELVRKMRASILALGPLLARTGRAAASLPGGCAIGVRPIDIHLAGFKKLGAASEVIEGVVRLTAKNLTGRTLRFKFPSVGATENLLMAAALAKGKTVIANAAKEPEIVDHADFLNKMGAKISGAGADTIVIEGQERLHGATHRVIPDRIETATYLIAAAATRGHLKLTGTRSSHLFSVLKELGRAGTDVRIEKDFRLGVESIVCKSGKTILPVSVKTGPYPAFPTDVQAQWMALMALAQGKSAILESIFENRFVHAAELVRMGAKIQIKDRRAVITGVRSLSGTHVMVSDLRTGAPMIIEGLASKGKPFVQRI